jgi:hypothetical protein
MIERRAKELISAVIMVALLAPSAARTAFDDQRPGVALGL